jgi:hypothetical protein
MYLFCDLMALLLLVVAVPHLLALLFVANKIFKCQLSSCN